MQKRRHLIWDGFSGKSGSGGQWAASFCGLGRIHGGHDEWVTREYTISGNLGGRNWKTRPSWGNVARSAVRAGPFPITSLNSGVGSGDTTGEVISPLYTTIPAVTYEF